MNPDNRDIYIQQLIIRDWFNYSEVVRSWETMARAGREVDNARIKAALGEAERRVGG